MLSVLLTTYNHGPFVVSALRSLFEQDFPEPFEIVVCDDASSDNTLELLKKLSPEKPDRVTLVFAPPGPNLGLIRNLERGVALSSGNLLVLQSGDDVSAPNRLSELARLFSKKPDLKAAYSNATLIDATDRVLRPLYHPTDFVWQGEPLTLAPFSSAFLGASSCYRREVWDKFGKVNPGIIQEDLVLPFRAALLGETAYLAEPLVRYRLHGGNAYFSSQSGMSAREFREKRLRIVANQVLVHQQRQADLRHIKPSHPQASLIEAAICRQFREAEFELGLGKRGHLGVAAALSKSLFQRTLRETARLAAHHLFTGLYLRLAVNS